MGRAFDAIAHCCQLQTEKLIMDKNIQPSAQSNDLNAGTMRRAITWKDTFWITTGILTSILFSIGAMAATVGTSSLIVVGAFNFDWVCAAIFVC